MKRIYFLIFQFILPLQSSMVYMGLKKTSVPLCAPWAKLWCVLVGLFMALLQGMISAVFCFGQQGGVREWTHKFGAILPARCHSLSLINRWYIWACRAMLLKDPLMNSEATWTKPPMEEVMPDKDVWLVWNLITIRSLQVEDKGSSEAGVTWFSSSTTLWIDYLGIQRRESGIWYLSSGVGFSDLIAAGVLKPEQSGVGKTSSTRKPNQPDLLLLFQPRLELCNRYVVALTTLFSTLWLGKAHLQKAIL